MTAVEVTDLIKEYGSVSGVDSISFVDSSRIQRGEIHHE